MKRLFDQKIENCEANCSFVKIRDDERNVYTREWLESLWKTYSEYADSHFLAEFARQTHPRFWEMYLTCALLDLGNTVERTQTDQPDVRLNHNGKSIWIEAKAPTRGTGENAVPGIKTGGTTMVPLDEMTLRFTSGMGDARRQRQNMIKSRRIGETDSYIVAVNTWDTYWIGTNKALPQITRALFGVGDLQYSFETDEAEYSHQGSISKKTKDGVKQIEIGLFDNPDFASISAVIQSSAHTGFGRVEGHLGRDFVLLRNPFAINPIADGDIKGVHAFRFEDLLTEGVEGEPDIDLTSQEWNAIRQEGLDRLSGEPS